MYKFTSDGFRAIWENAVSQNRWKLVGAGTNSALIVVDGVIAYTEPGSPLEVPDHSFIDKGIDVLTFFRQNNLPILHTTVVYEKPGHKGGVFRKKVPSLEIFDEDHDLGLGKTIPGWEAKQGEEQFTKHYASVFSGTDIATTLTFQKIDTVFLMGLSTSGCVRATAVDACERGFLPVIIGDACGDRHPNIHEASLFDVGAKYGDVIAAEDLETYIK